MAIIQADIKLGFMARTMSVQLYFPTDLPESVGNKVQGVITLLHGYSGTGADWFSMTAAPRYAADNGYILVAPSVDNSFYTNMACGGEFYTALTEELPRQLNSIFHIPAERDCNYICGLSMGGYGAMKLALNHPERYAAAASFSGAVDMGACLRLSGPGTSFYKPFAAVFGSDLRLPPEGDLLHMAAETARLPRARQPRLLCTCGRQDDDDIMHIRTQNLGFKAYMETLDLDFTYMEWDGVHEWNYWDRSLAEFIGFIQQSDYHTRKRKDWAAG